MGAIDVNTETVLRFNSDVASRGALFTDANGYETTRRQYNASKQSVIAANYWPATTTAFLTDGNASQLGLVFDRTHGVGSAGGGDGALEVMLHRRSTFHEVSGAGEWGAPGRVDDTAHN